MSETPRTSSFPSTHEDDEFNAAAAMAAKAKATAKPATIKVSKQKRFGFKTLDDELTIDTVRIRHKMLTIRLRKNVALAAIVFVAIQIVCSNWFFGKYVYANVSKPDSLDPTIMIAWLSSSVVEIVGILGIVALSLFPNKNGKSDKASAGK